MTPAIATVLLLLVVAVVLFATEKLPVDIVTLLLVIALVLTGTLTPAEAFAGFGNEIVITIAGLFVLTSGLVKTGIVDVVGRRLHAVAGGNAFWLAALVMIVAAASAAVMKNTTTTAMFLPVVLGLSARARIPPSKLLMPLAFGAILGGTCTLIGTSTNLAVSGALQRLGYEPLGMFELTPVGVVIVLVGMSYMLLIGLRLLPARGGASLAEEYQLREYVSEVLVLEGSPLVGQTLAEADLATKLDLQTVGVVRGEGGRMAPAPETRIEAGDLLLVHGRAENILRVKAEAGLEIKPDLRLSGGAVEHESDEELFEVMIARGTSLVGRTLKGAKFKERFGLTVLAINRHGVTLLSKMSTVSLRFGDVLLVQGRREQVEYLVADGHAILLEDVSGRRERSEKRKWAVLAFGVFLFFSITHTGGVPLVVAVLFGVLVLLATKTVRTNELYDPVEWRLLVLIAGMISFGVALEKTGADDYLAGQIVRFAGGYGETAVLAGFFLLTVALTQPMSNQAAALVVLPIAVKTATALGLNPRAFAIAVTYAASCSFLTPLEPACVLIYTPGGYRFLDFVKIGSILTILVFLVVMLLVPKVWGL